MKKDNKRRRKTTYIRRFFAVFLSMTMLLSMTPEVFAESFAAPESAISGPSVETITDNTESDSQPVAEDESTGTGETEGSSEQIEETKSTVTEESDSFTDGDSVASGEENTETIAPDDEASEEFISEETTEMPPEDLVEDESEIELLLNLLAEGDSTIRTSPSLSLSDALKYTDAQGATDVISIDNDTLTVSGAAGLILLSNVKPNEYKDLNITLKTTSAGWNVTGQQVYTYTETAAEGEETTGTTQTITCSFLGLGSEDSPYAGTMKIAEGSTGYSITANRALFNAISTSASLLDSISFLFKSEANTVNAPLLAEKVVNSNGNTLTCGVTLTVPTSGETVTSATIGGIIDTLGENAKASVTLTNNLTGTLTVSGGEHRGLFCNTMNANSSLTAELKKGEEAGNIAVAASGSNHDAGGYVGKMESGGTLTISGKTVNTVTSEGGNAGGLVGSAKDAAIEVTNGKATPFELSNVTITATNGNAGGLVGDYTNTNTITTDDPLNLAQFTLGTTLSGGTNAGGVFGTLTNSGSYTIGGNAVSSSLSGASGSYGGLIGKYEAQGNGDTPARNASLTISDITGDNKITSTGGDNVTTYGGVIGTVSGSSYVAMDGVSVSTAAMPGKDAYFGGLVGKMEDGLLNVGNVTLTTTDSYDISADDVGGRGGLVGAITKGVLRLHGTTDLSGQKITTAYHHTGQIVGNNNNGLVYATGTGSNAATDGTGWTLKRYSGNDRSGSDIGNWGEVVRLDGTNLSEGDGGLLTFDSNAHTVTVKGLTVDGTTNDITLSNVQEFAAYALAFNLNSGSNYKESDSNAVLSFATIVNPSATQYVTLSAIVNLTGTGILGIGRDNMSGSAFSGTFDGTSNTITLDIGSAYGKVGEDNATSESKGSGQVYAKRADGRDAHYSVALFPYGKGITVNNLTVTGNVYCTIGNSAQKEKDVKASILAAAIVGQSEGTTEFNKVTVNADVSVADTSGKNIYAAQGGFLGLYKSDASGSGGTLKFSDCKWTSESTLSSTRTNDYNRVGGYAGMVFGGGTNVTASKCEISGTITAEKIQSNAAVGGLIAESRNDYIKSDGNLQTSNNINNTISISNLTVSGETINTNAGTSSGGLLGYSWNKTDVTFGTNASTDESGNTVPATGGVTISNCNLNANNAKFGGLVYQATGYWNATAANSIHFTGTNTTIKGKSDKDNPSGLLVGTGIDNSDSKNIKALYLEVGTWGNATDAAYKIEENAVTLTLGGNPATAGSYFDELVGTTIQGNAGHDNAIVSLAVRESDGITAAKIDTETSNCNTYKGQIENYENGKTRYYYNLDSYRTSGTDGAVPDAGSLNSADKALSWSVSQYAAENIRSYFCPHSSNGATISGTIDLTGYSYYPVTPLAGVTVGVEGTTTTLTFAYEEMNGKETNNKPFQESNQHYLMHHGLLYDTGSNVTVNYTTFTGTVGKESTTTANKFNSGALIFGNVSGDTTTNPATVPTVQLKNVTLAGLKMSGVDSSTTTYAPLLINTISKAVTLTVDGLSTGENYVDMSNNTAYAATSLIGRVGSSTATKLTLTFSSIALDSRKERTGSGTSVSNNGQKTVEYNTYHTIFTRATLLESFQYSADSSGVYNFNSDDTQVTYGVEISNTSTGRNIDKPNKQYQYYNGGYVWDGLGGTATTEDTIKTYFNGDSYLRYVNSVEGTEGGYHELDINQKATNLTEGCGTYGDPYIITDGNQLIDLAKFIDEKNVSEFQVTFNKDVLNAKKQESTSYHTSENRSSDKDLTYTWDGSSWSAVTEGAESITKDDTLKYLLNAYYEIRGSIEIPLASGDYQGLGSNKNPFSGVITGNTVRLTGTLSSQNDFSGLIRYSQGSVVKDLTVDYTDATITMSNTAIPSSSNNPFFGGVVGYCMGGDTIIENVSVNYGTYSVKLNDSNARLIAAGGYVGLVGGVKNSSGYEKTGGGVVFRNMGNHTNNFADYQTNAKDNSDYFYCNPYVGRVLDGYACYDGGTAGQFTLNNTDKNYTIPYLVTEKSKGLTVTTSESGLAATVSSAQGLWLLSAIVNSGAGAMDDTGSYTDVNEKVDAYQLGKPRSRTADYSKIGMSITEDTAKANALADEGRWGGVPSGTTAGQDTTRVSYLVSGFTDKASDTYYAARLTGSDDNATTNTNNPVSLTFSEGEIKMISYGNGFRGIGGSYGQSNRIWNTEGKDKLTCVYRRTLYVNAVNGATSETTLKLKMNQWDYWEEDNYSDKSNPGFFNQGAGLFTNFSYVAGCQVKNLTICGEVKLHTYKAEGSEFHAEKGNGDDFDICVGAFAARTKNASGTLTFNNFHLSKINVYGGTQTGGAIGCIEKSGGDKTVTFQNWSLNNATIETKLNNDGGAGGLIGWYYGGEKLTVDTGTVNSTKVKTQSQSVNSNNVGGLVNGSNCEVEVKNVTFNGLSASGTKLNAAGGVVGSAQAKITVDGCNFSGLSVEVTGSKSVGGLIGYSNNDTTITGTNIQCTADNLAKISNDGTGDERRTGGFIGYAGSSKTTAIENCSAEYLYVLSKSRTGGLLGQNSNKPANIRNVTMRNVIVTTREAKGGAGLLASYVGDNDKTIKGYNILADSCRVGYCATTDVTVESLASAEFTPSDYVGRWTGQLKGGAMNLVAVATKNGVLPDSDIGSVSTGTASIVYADYPADTTNWEGNGSASPYVDVNPKNDVTVMDGDNSITLTGNGVGYIMTTTTSTDEEGNQTTTTTKGKSIAQTILEEVNKTNKTYWNLVDGDDKKFSQFLDHNNSAYVTTYQEEEKNASIPDDFPILVVTSLTDTNDLIWNYIAALTNVESGDKAREQAESVTAATYKWTKDSAATEASDGTFAGSFVKKNDEEASLSVDSSKKISITPNAYDNQQSQFTLLDVKYTDPTYSSNSFHLYVPVLVKKVLYVSFSAKFLAGTNYRKDAYESANTYATAGFNEPVTAYIEYNYDRTKGDWQAMLDNGENLLWKYDKVLDLASDKQGENLLPNGTRLTLVDKQTGQCYIHTFGSTDNVNRFDLSTMTLDGSADTTKFQPVPICDLLGLTATKNDSGTYVEETDPQKYTVRVTSNGVTTYYRKADDSDTGDKYTISVGSNLSNNTTGTNYLPQGEGYYLTIQVPSSDDASVVNNSLSVNSTTMRKDGAPLASIRETLFSTYVIYDGVQQSELSITTLRIKNGVYQADTKMEDGDSIQVTLTSTLSLTESGKQKFRDYAPTELDHQFNINMKKHLKTETGESVDDVVIGATGVKYTYTIKRKDGTELYSSDETKNNSEFLDTLTIDSASNASDASADMIRYLKSVTDGTLTITAVITLPYPTVGTYFPGRISSDNQSGISVSADSRVATATTQLPITTHKKTKEDSNRYYTQNPSNAKLTYNTYDGDGTGDSTRKLGINPSDTINDPDGLIYTSGVYDYSNVDAGVLSQAKRIKYTLELFRKEENGSYNEGSPLPNIDGYLPGVTVTGGGSFSHGDQKGAKTLTKDFSGDLTTRFDSINITIKPLTGAAFEAKKFTYANYKVRLTAVLLDGNGDELTDTKASDYIIYTNARICQQIIQQTSASSGE